MPQPRGYSVEEVLNFTLKDIQEPTFVDVEIKGWLELTSEQQEQCSAKLRDLMRQRDEIAQPKAVDARKIARSKVVDAREIGRSKAVDASDLGARLNRTEPSRSSSCCTGSTHLYNPDDPKQIKADLKAERKEHERLVRDNGRPCYPIELGLDIFKHSGQYKEILEYWNGESDASEPPNRRVFFHQHIRWEAFRRFQQLYRGFFVRHKRFPEFRQEVVERRRRHGLDGDVQLFEERDKQSKLDDWIEYQDYELGIYERLQKDFKEAQELLASGWKALAEAKISEFKVFREPEFARYKRLAWQYSGEERDAKAELGPAERKLRLAETMLQAAGSDDLGESVERASWVELFRKELKSAQMRRDELERLAENIERELGLKRPSYYGRKIEWRKERLKDPEGRMIGLESDSTEFKGRMKKLKEIDEEMQEVYYAFSWTEKEVKFVEEMYDAARLDNPGETVKRSALIQMAQREVKSAHTQVEQAKELLEKIKLKGKISSLLSLMSLLRRNIKRHEVLLEWVERQRQEIAGGGADIKKEGGQSQSKVSSRVLRNRPTTEAPGLNKSPKKNVRQRKQSAARSILSPVDPAKVSSKKRSSGRKLSALCDSPQAATQMTIDSTAPEPRSKRASTVEGAMPASLHSTHSSEVGKPGRKVVQQSADASLRRSTRISKQPERFRPGYT